MQNNRRSSLVNQSNLLPLTDDVGQNLLIHRSQSQMRSTDLQEIPGGSDPSLEREPATEIKKPVIQSLINTQYI